VDDLADCEQLLTRARGDDRRALGQLLEMFRAYLKLLARIQINRRLQGKMDASDIVQETFLQAQRNFSQFRGTTEAEMMAWLRTILVSQIKMLIRRYGTGKRDAHLEQELDREMERSSQGLLGSVVAPVSSPSQQASRREHAVILAEALNGLRPDYREVIILRHFEEKSFPDIARRMGQTVDAVKNKWARAIKQLRQKLGDLA
jgi:RNA polymerase sigma-70 factor (ECF subfamily)